MFVEEERWAMLLFGPLVHRERQEERARQLVSFFVRTIRSRSSRRAWKEQLFVLPALAGRGILT
jgi:hypothetical protein